MPSPGPIMTIKRCYFLLQALLEFAVNIYKSKLRFKIFKGYNSFKVPSSMYMSCNVATASEDAL